MKQNEEKEEATQKKPDNQKNRTEETTRTRTEERMFLMSMYRIVEYDL